MDNPFLQKQTQLQAQAKIVLKRLDLVSLLSKYGKVTMVGSFALGLMTWPDIDIDLKSNGGINDKDYFELVTNLFENKSIKQLKLIDNRRSFEKNRPKSMYIGIIYDLDVVDWKIDIRYLDLPATKAKDDLKRIKSKLTPEKVNTILEIKTALHSHPKYGKEFSGVDIYNAVLESNIITLIDFKELLKEKGIRL